MGTLLNQKERPYMMVTKHDLTNTINMAKQAAKESGVLLDQAIRVMDIAERSRANSLYAYDGDAKDEQLAGFGEIAMDLVSKFEGDDD